MSVFDSQKFKMPSANERKIESSYIHLYVNSMQLLENCSIQSLSLLFDHAHPCYCFSSLENCIFLYPVRISIYNT